MIRKNDVIVCGFALFAIFFGAGNLIFPPYLGVISGNQWWLSSFGFLLSDPFFPILGVIVTIMLGGQAEDLGRKVNPGFAKLLGIISILLIGPLFSVPRTGATTHEVFVQSFFPNSPQWITSMVFFGLTLMIALNSTKVIGVIGRFITPALLITLFIVFIAAIVNPPATTATVSSKDLFANSFREGYQTMDALGASLMAGVVVSDLKRRGYQDRKLQVKAGIAVGLVAFILLAVVYAGLTYAGSTVSSIYQADTDRAAIFIGMIDALLGPVGRIAMGIIVALACFTTAVGLTSTCGNFFESISHGKLSYKNIVLITVVVEFLMSLLGVDAIINIAVPILTFIYPLVMVLILFSIFDDKIESRWTYIGGLWGAGIVSLIQSINIFGKMNGVVLLNDAATWIKTLPLSPMGLEWLTPAVLFAVLATIVVYFVKPKEFITES